MIFSSTVTKNETSRLRASAQAGEWVGLIALFFRLSVCFSARYHKTNAATITKHDRYMFHDESWKLIYFGVNRSKVKVTRHKKLPGVCTLVNVGFF